MADEENEEDLKNLKKVSDDLNDVDADLKSGTGSRGRNSDDSEEESSEDEGPKWGGEEDSDHEEEDLMPTLTASMSGNENKYVARLVSRPDLSSCVHSAN